MYAEGDQLNSEPQPIHPLSIAMEASQLEQSSPEKNLWNAVLLQLLKEAEYIRRELVNTQQTLNEQSADQYDKETAFDGHWKAKRKQRSLEIYLKTELFVLVCDYAGHNELCVSKKIVDILRNRCSMNDNQVKRTFTRKPDPRGKKII